MFKNKCVVLSDTENNSDKKAVLSMSEEVGGIKGTLRLYNFPKELDGVSSLGFFVDKKVFKAGLTFKAHRLYEFFLDLNEIPSKFSCAVVNFQNAVASPLLFGSSEGSDDAVYGSIISEITKDNSKQNTESVLDKFGIDFDDQQKKEIEKDIDDAICQTCDSCQNCIYKKFFFENQSQDKQSAHCEEKQTIIANQTFENDFSANEILQENPSEQYEDNKTEDLFFDRLKPQIDKLFQNNPAETNLQTMIPSSKWVKVEYEDDGDFYVFGLLYDEDNEIRYVCYGVPAVFEEEPPKELSGYPIWLPLDKENLKGFGYWLTYQDASTGEPVKAILD